MIQRAKLVVVELMGTLKQNNKKAAGMAQSTAVAANAAKLKEMLEELAEVVANKRSAAMENAGIVSGLTAAVMRIVAEEEASTGDAERKRTFEVLSRFTAEISAALQGRRPSS